MSVKMKIRFCSSLDGEPGGKDHCGREEIKECPLVDNLGFSPPFTPKQRASPHSIL